MALNLSTLTSPATSGDVLAEVLTTADFLEGVPVLRNLARGSQKGGDAEQSVALNQPKALPLAANGKGYLYLSGVSGNYASGPTTGELGGLDDVTIQVDDVSSDWATGARRVIVATTDIDYFGLRVQADRTIQAFFSPDANSNSNETKTSTAAFTANDFDSISIRVVRDTTANTVTYFVDSGSGFVQLGDALSVTGATTFANTTDLEIGSRNNGVHDKLKGKIGRVRVWPNTTMTEGTEVLDVDFTATNVRHGDTKFACATGQVVTINKSGNDPATVIKKPVLRFDGANSSLFGAFGQTIDSGYMFAALSVLGNGGTASQFNRIFGCNSAGSFDSSSGGFAFRRDSTTDGLMIRYNATNVSLHDGFFNSQRGDYLVDLKVLGGSQQSKVNNADADNGTGTVAGALSSEEFSIAAQSSNSGTQASFDLEFLAFFDASITDTQADQIRNYINNRNNVFDLKDGFGYYFYDAQNAPVGNISSGSASWNGRIVGSDNGDTDKLATQSTSADQPVSDGYVVTFADNTDHLVIPSTTQAGWQIVGTSLGTFAYKVDADAVTELNLLGNLGDASSRQAGDLYGIILLPESATGSEINEAKKLLTDRGAADGATATDISNYFRNRSDIVEFGNVDTSNVTRFSNAWSNCSSLTSFPLIDTSSGTNFSGTWQNCSSLTSFPLVNTSLITVFYYTWTGCSSLTSFPLIDTSSVTNFRSAWHNCSSLTSFPQLDTSSGTNFTNAWQGCSSLTSFPLINTSLVENFYYAWYNCNSLTSFPLIDTSSGTSFGNTWYNCSSLTSFPLINTSSVTSFYQTWRNCSSLTSFPAINTSSGTSFVSAWWGCSSLTSFPAINTSSGTDFTNTWRSCSSLTSFPQLDTSSGTNFNSAWYNCNSLTSFPDIDTSSGTDFYRAWRDCSSLTSFGLINPESALRFRETWMGCSDLATFPANFFDDWSPPSLYSKTFDNAWDGCTSLTAQSVENILTSIDTSGIYGTDTGLSSGTQLGDHTIDIDYDGTTLSSATTTAIANLKNKDWAININNVIQ
jgi:hypothetical protein